jgi:hypothetical protein
MIVESTVTGFSVAIEKFLAEAARNHPVCLGPIRRPALEIPFCPWIIHHQIDFLLHGCVRTPRLAVSYRQGKEII